MKRSRFWTFAFSMIPGLGHIYLGLPVRGICIMGGFSAWAFLSFLMVYQIGGVETLLVLAPLPIVWLFGLVDALGQCDRMNSGVPVADPLPVDRNPTGSELLRPDGVGILLFSVVPGAGQMRLGRMRRGLELMAMFFGALYLAYSLRLNVFLFTLPAIWFYSFFDSLQLASSKSVPSEDMRPKPFVWQPRWVGIGLIVVGAVILFDRIAPPLFRFSYQTLEMIRTGITASLFIGGGVWLMRGKKVRPSDSDDGREPEDRSEDRYEEESK